MYINAIVTPANMDTLLAAIGIQTQQDEESKKYASDLPSKALKQGSSNLELYLGNNSLGKNENLPRTLNPAHRSKNRSWTHEEETYCSGLVLDFEAGLLDIPPQTTLQYYLSIALNCDESRIVKKLKKVQKGKNALTFLEILLFFSLNNNPSFILFNI